MRKFIFQSFVLFILLCTGCTSVDSIEEVKIDDNVFLKDAFIDLSENMVNLAVENRSNNVFNLPIISQQCSHKAENRKKWCVFFFIVRKQERDWDSVNSGFVYVGDPLSFHLDPGEVVVVKMPLNSIQSFYGHFNLTQKMFDAFIAKIKNNHDAYVVFSNQEESTPKRIDFRRGRRY